MHACCGYARYAQLQVLAAVRHRGDTQLLREQSKGMRLYLFYPETALFESEGLGF